MKKTVYLLSSNLLITLIMVTGFAIFSFQKSYNTFTKEEPVAILTFEKIQDQKYLASIYLEQTNKKVNQFVIFGDQWRLDAEFKKFKYFANLLNINNKYQLSRLEGRYKTVEDQNTKENLAYDLTKFVNQSFLKQVNLEDILIDTEYGASVYKDINENAIYKVYKTNTGLITRTEIIEVFKQPKAKQIYQVIEHFFK